MPTYALSALAHHLESLWMGFGNVESEYLRNYLDKIEGKQEMYISGLARSGTTITLNFLYNTNEFGSLTYRNYPFIHFPYIWHKITSLSQCAQEKERAHFDRIRVSIDSPEALEEMLWMRFFPHSFQENANYPPDEKTQNSKFECFYSDFIKKVLLTSDKNRYLAKGNYNLARAPYILKNSKTAKFILCVRDPLTHIASLMKQHYLFSKIETEDKRLKNYMDWIGHKEFGLNRCPVYLGKPEEYRKIIECWDSGKEVEGWALQWKYTYDFIIEKILKTPEISDRVYLLRYENLCRNPFTELGNITAFCGIDKPTNLEQTAQGISAPDYYDLPFSVEEEELITTITGKTQSLIYNQST